MERMQETEAYVTIKDHKEDFPNKVSCRLINPSKSDIGKISKAILDKINEKVLLSTKVNQWKNTNSVIEWFRSINNKSECAFVIFDIVNFYPSITKELLEQAIQFTKTITDISTEDTNIIMQARKTLLFHDDQPWIKKSGTDNFDVPMGYYDGAEICELVGSFILEQLKTIVLDKKLVGLYRDDGLGVFRKMSGPETERKKKEITKLFKNYGLSITIKTNLHLVDFLDVQFDLKLNQHQPYMKPNNSPVYVNRNSNHSPPILKQLPISINKRISELCSNKEIYDISINPYKAALRKSGFTTEPSYTPSVQLTETEQQEKTQKKKRKRKVIWFNLPFSKNVKTNVGKIVLKLVKKHFPKEHMFHKIFNKNTIKVSYSCMPNIGTIISGHNKQLLHPRQETYGCNCRKKLECPMQGKCLTPSLIYEAEITNDTDGDQKIYIGACETTFKERYRNHIKDMKHRKYIKSTELSKYVWSLKDEGKNPSMRWRIIKTIRSKTRLNYCKLCLSEKLILINSLDDPNILNSKSEFISKCRHDNKFMIKNVK